jgi:septal ring factor EnvC (AmiA/AmiB activator)
MTEHRLVLDPDVARRVGAGVVAFAEAWEGDIAALRRVESELAETQRMLNAAADRASGLQGDLAAAREENRALINRNAYLEAQIQSLYEKSHDAKDVMESLASKAVEVARAAPSVEPRPQWRDPEKKPPVDDEEQPPESFRRGTAVLAPNEFQPRSLAQ